MRIYADNAATTPLSRAALDAMLPCMTDIYGNPSSLHTIGQQAKDMLETARERVASCLGCAPSEVIFTSGGSEADNQAIRSAARFGALHQKKHIISTAFEHHAVLHTLRQLEREGFTVTLLDVHENGVISPQQVADAIREDTCLVTVMFANNEIGTIQPIAAIGDICRKRGVPFHTDAVQAVGQLPVDFHALQADYLSLSAHKFHGPKGIGALLVRKGARVYNLIEGGAQERSKRAGTENLAAIVGMAAALEESVAQIPQRTPHLLQLRQTLIDGLSAIPHAALNGDPLERLPGNVNFCFEGIEGESLLLLLDDKGIAASSGSACTSGSLEPSHVLLAIGRPHEIAHGSLRLTMSADTTQEEAAFIVDAVRDVVDYLRCMSPVWHSLQDGTQPFLLP